MTLAHRSDVIGEVAAHRVEYIRSIDRARFIGVLDAMAPSAWRGRVEAARVAVSPVRNRLREVEEFVCGLEAIVLEISTTTSRTIFERCIGMVGLMAMGSAGEDLRVGAGDLVFVGRFERQASGQQLIEM